MFFLFCFAVVVVGGSFCFILRKVHFSFLEDDPSVSVFKEVLYDATSVHGQGFMLLHSLLAFSLQEVTYVILCCINRMGGRCDGCLCFEEIVDKADGAGC